MANDCPMSGRKPYLELIPKIHINQSGIADYYRKLYKDKGAEPTDDIIGSFDTSAGAAVNVRATTCHYGGYRFWFVCPACDGNRLILRYIEPKNNFYCNSCLSGVHRITQMSKVDRRFNRRANIRERLGLKRRHGLRDWIHTYHKPKGMHWNTFYPLMWRHNHLIEIDAQKWIATSKRLFPHVFADF